MNFIEIVKALIQIEISLPPKENSLSDLLLRKLGHIEISKGFSLLVEEPACLKMSFEGVARERAANILHQEIKNQQERIYTNRLLMSQCLKYQTHYKKYF